MHSIEKHTSQHQNKIGEEFTLNSSDSNIFIVTTAHDENDGQDGGKGLSLREAISLANNTEGADIIEFERNLSGSTITLSLGELKIDDSPTKNLNITDHI